MSTSLQIPTRLRLPGLIAAAPQPTQKRFLEFFAAQIRNKNTREAYMRAAYRFMDWCRAGHITELRDIEPMHVAAYVELLPKLGASKPTVKLHLAALRMLFDWLVIGQIIPTNPAASVRGPKYVIKRGMTPVLSPAEAKQLLESIETDSHIGLRDRALIATMLYSFARVSAVCSMQVADYFTQGRRAWLRLHEKGGKLHEVPVHHKSEEMIDSYLDQTAIRIEPKSPLWRSADRRTKRLTGKAMSRVDAFRMIKRRALKAGLDPLSICCHSFRATGITVFMENGGRLETAAQIAAHESPRTTKLYDRTNDKIALEEIERIRF